MESKLVIIGAGSAGLSAGCYARMNGYDTTIVEMADTPGGLCTSWKRQGYLFDGSVAGLAGAGQGSPLYRLWEEIGVMAYCPLYYGDDFGDIHLKDGRVVTVYTNINRLEEHLLSVFPEESRFIKKFAGTLHRVQKLDLPFSDAQGLHALAEGLKTGLSMAPLLPLLFKYGGMSIGEFTAGTRNQDLKAVIENMGQFGGMEVPILTIMLPLAYAHRRLAGIPQKGWLSFARAIERRFIELGGKIQYGVKVTGLTTDGGHVSGVELGNGAILEAQRVLSAIDGVYAMRYLQKKSEQEIARCYQQNQLSDQPVQINFGVKEDFTSQKGSVTYLLNESFYAAGKEHARITVHNKCNDPDAAPSGKSALTVFLDSDYPWWESVAKDPFKYRLEKQRCADEVSAVIARYHPGFKERIEVTEVSTPLTRERYTGNWHGAMQARKPNPGMIKAITQGTPVYADPSLPGLYLAGQWIEPWGGITTAVQSGRNAIREMCKNDGKSFTSQNPHTEERKMDEKDRT